MFTQNIKKVHPIVFLYNKTLSSFIYVYIYVYSNGWIEWADFFVHTSASMCIYVYSKYKESTS